MALRIVSKIIPSILAVGLLITAICYVPASPAASGWRTYSDPDYGFRLSYPGDMKFLSGASDYKEISLSSYFPVCGGETIACFLYNGPNRRGPILKQPGSR